MKVQRILFGAQVADHADVEVARGAPRARPGRSGGADW